MNPIQIFSLFCLESYKNEANLTGRQALSEFKKYDVFKFLSDFYDILHSQSIKYTVAEITEFIKARK